MIKNNFLIFFVSILICIFFLLNSPRCSEEIKFTVSNKQYPHQKFILHLNKNKYYFESIQVIRTDPNNLTYLIKINKLKFLSNCKL